MTVHDYFVLNRSDRERLTERVRAAMARWQNEWCAGKPPEVEVGIAGEREHVETAQSAWQAARLDHADMAAAVAVTSAPATLLSTLIGSKKTESDLRGDIAAELGQSALRGLLAQLFEAGGVELRGRALRWENGEPVCNDATRGFVTAQCACGETRMTIVLYPRLTHSIVRVGASNGARSRARLHARRAALAAERVMVDVCVGQAELPLSELATLAVGDVLCLDRRLEQPALVKLDGGAPLCAGHLGLMGEHKAIQLTFLQDNEGV